MRVDAGIDRLASMRVRLGLATPCPHCSDKKQLDYCDACIRALAAVMGESPEAARERYGRKRWLTPET